MVFLNPFKKYVLEDFPDVHIPLARASHDSNAVAEKPRRSSDDTNLTQSDTALVEMADNVGATPSCRRPTTLESLRAEIDVDVVASGHDSVYDRKAKVINKAIQDIGMGQYQWHLFFLCGFGWLADNLWLQGVALSLNSLSQEYAISASEVRYTTLSLFVGLCVGSCFWGTISDVIGRRPAFNLTLLICAIFGMAVYGARTWIQACALYAAAGIGVGGNLPVDGVLFMEFLPFASGNLLTMMSIWWPIGQLVGSGMAYGLIPKYSCAAELKACSLVTSGQQCCTKADNMGWRYLNLSMGGFTLVMFLLRLCSFHLFESPKFLLSRGRQRDAIVVICGIAYANNKKTWLSEEVLNEIGGIDEEGEKIKLSHFEITIESIGRFSTERLRPLFAYKRLAINTTMIWFIWAAIGMGYPLFNSFLPQYIRAVNPNAPPESNDIVYRNYFIESLAGCPGVLLACYTVDVKYLGRKGTLAIATLLMGIFLFLFTISANAKFQLGFACAVQFFQYIMYGVLFTYTPETFPAPNRGTGTGVASFFNRAAGLCAPIVAIKGSSADPKVPIYISGALMLSASIAMVALPIETRGKQRL